MGLKKKKRIRIKKGCWAELSEEERKIKKVKKKKKQSGINDLIVTSQKNGSHNFFFTTLPL